MAYNRYSGGSSSTAPSAASSGQPIPVEFQGNVYSNRPSTQKWLRQWVQSNAPAKATKAEVLTGAHTSPTGGDQQIHFTIRIYYQYDQIWYDKNKQGHTKTMTTYYIYHVYQDGTYAEYSAPGSGSSQQATVPQDPYSYLLHQNKVDLLKGAIQLILRAKKGERTQAEATSKMGQQLEQLGTPPSQATPSQIIEAMVAWGSSIGVDAERTCKGLKACVDYIKKEKEEEDDDDDDDDDDDT